MYHIGAARGPDRGRAASCRPLHLGMQRSGTRVGQEKCQSCRLLWPSSGPKPRPRPRSRSRSRSSLDQMPVPVVRAARAIRVTAGAKAEVGQVDTRRGKGSGSKTCRGNRMWEHWQLEFPPLALASVRAGNRRRITAAQSGRSHCQSRAKDAEVQLPVEPLERQWRQLWQWESSAAVAAAPLRRKLNSARLEARQPSRAPHQSDFDMQC